MLLAKQVSLTNVVALHGVSLAGERRRGADPKRLPVWVWWRLLRTGRIGHRHHGEPDTSHDLFEHCSLPFLPGQALGMRDDSMSARARRKFQTDPLPGRGQSMCARCGAQHRQACDTGSGGWTRIEDSWVVDQRVG